MSELDPSFDPNVDPALAEERAHRRRLARSTAVFGAATGLSRVLGLVREIVAASTFGAAGRINAFTVAFQIPNLVRALVADTALSGAFVPVFSELLEKGERLRAWRVASTIFWLVLLITTGLTAVFILIAPLIVEQMASSILELKKQGLSILLSEQNIHFARLVSDRVYVLEKGQIHWQGSVAELDANPEVQRTYLTV